MSRFGKAELVIGVSDPRGITGAPTLSWGDAIAELVPGAEAPGIAGRMTLLTDATASVGGFENLGHAFVSELTAKGMTLATTRDVA